MSTTAPPIVPPRDTRFDLHAGGKPFFQPFNEQHPYITATEPHIFLWGDRGGGKSYLARMHCHAMATQFENFKYIIVRRSHPELMKTHTLFLPGEMEQLGGERNKFSYNKTDHIAYYPKGSVGFYHQCDNDEDVRKVLGAEAALIVFDEAPELEWSWMMEIKASIRVPTGSPFSAQTRFLGNPYGPSIAELWSYFIDKDVDPEEDPEYLPADWRAINLNLRSNPHLDHAKYRKQFSGITNQAKLKAWRDGERTLDYALFTMKPSHLIDELPQWDGKPIIDPSLLRP